jgi:endoglycosylceramidase
MKYLLFITMAILYMGYVAEAQCKFVSVKDNRFIDAEGREIILHGVNIEDKSKQHNYLSWHGSEEFTKMRQWGFNCIRLVIIWDGIEPKPGIYNDEYLAGIDKRIQWAKENGIYVLLDMHQDLFSAKFGGDGAPSWAVIDNGKPHVFSGSVWSMAYLTSPGVHAAFDNFWANKPASDGVGLQDHFAKAWQYVAKRYANEPTVIGYDLFNEPFTGSSIEESVYLKLKAVADILAVRKGESSASFEVMQKLMASGELAGYANDMELFKAFADGGKSVSMEFEQTILAQFYNRVTKAIREVDQNHIVFFETHGLCNSGTPSGVVPITDSNGNRDPLQAFAPHGYDIVTDTKDVANANSERIDLIFTRHAETATRLKMPTLVGEWGAYYGQPNTLPAAQAVVRQIEKNLFSDTYWSYSSAGEIDNAQYFPILSKPYPATISGNLLQYESNLSNKSFACTWVENPEISAPSRIYLPEEWFPKGYKVILEPKDKGWSFEKVKNESPDGYLIISSTGKSTKRNLKVEILK